MPIKNKIVCNKSNINVMQNWKLKTSLKQAKQGLMGKNCFTKIVFKDKHVQRP